MRMKGEEEGGGDEEEEREICCRAKVKMESR